MSVPRPALDKFRVDRLGPRSTTLIRILRELPQSDESLPHNGCVPGTAMRIPKHRIGKVSLDRTPPANGHGLELKSGRLHGVADNSTPKDPLIAVKRDAEMQQIPFWL